MSLAELAEPVSAPEAVPCPLTDGAASRAGVAAGRVRTPMSIPRPVYLDHHATTPVDPRVLQAMLPYFNQVFGNASSRQHRFGWQAEEAVERARQQVAALIGARAKEIVFTSGATEANNLAIRGAVPARRARGAPRGHGGDRAPRGARHLPRPRSARAAA